MTTVSQMVIGGAAVLLAAQTGLNAVLPEPDPPAFIEVQRMEYEAGNVVFEREVAQDNFASWNAVVIDQDGVSICEGGGTAFYGHAERRTQVFSLDAFVGADCAPQPGAGYTLQASWVPRDGSAPVVARSEFTAALE